jgi:UDP-N-acetylmuramate dehydrogenase
MVKQKRRAALPMSDLRKTFGSRLQENVMMANFTSARIGGPADALLVVRSLDEMVEAATQLWALGAPFKLLGNGSNVLVSDAGLRAVVIINHARTIKINSRQDMPTAWAESGVNLAVLARRAALRGFAGLEWIAAIPGSLGGAIYGNAGAFGSDIENCLAVAEILHPKLGRQVWDTEQFEYSYRSSVLKRQPEEGIILAAELKLSPGNCEVVQERTRELIEKRRKSQPPGSGMGSIFKNPPGNHAGKLIEAAGLKGKRIGGAEISTWHANFIINRENATAEDIRQLIELAQEDVMRKFNVSLEMEIEMIGDWQPLA